MQFLRPTLSPRGKNSAVRSARLVSCCRAADCFFRRLDVRQRAGGEMTAVCRHFLTLSLFTARCLISVPFPLSVKDPLHLPHSWRTQHWVTQMDIGTGNNKSCLLLLAKNNFPSHSRSGISCSRNRNCHLGPIFDALLPSSRVFSSQTLLQLFVFASRSWTAWRFSGWWKEETSWTRGCARPGRRARGPWPGSVSTASRRAPWTRRWGPSSWPRWPRSCPKTNPGQVSPQTSPSKVIIEYNRIE